MLINDKLGRLTDVYQAPETLNLHAHYDYDELGNRTTQADANQHTTSFAYDNMGRRSSRKLPLGQTESYTYDNDGNLQTKTDFNGRTTSYAYDNLNRLLSKTPDAAFNSATVTFTYTATGRRQTMNDPSGQTVYTYNDHDRLQSRQTPFGTVSYTYDNAGNLLSISSSNQNGAAVTYTYDDLNRLATATVPGQAPTTYGYDPVGNLASVVYPNGMTTTYTYNLLNRLTKVAATTSNSALAGYQYTLGPAGNRTGVTELSGRTVTYGYDDVYRLTSETIASAASQNGIIGYVYDGVGNRKTMTSTVAALPAGLWNYDANDRITTDVYDNNGNTTSQAGIGNTYDFENHLVQHGDVAIVYDGDGNRVAKTVGGMTTNYLVDTNNPTGYAQVLEEIQNSQVLRQYAYGLDLISETQQINSAWKTSYYGYDGHGSVRYLTDANANVTDTYDYDAFGNLIASSGSTPNNYLYTGEQFDQDLNLYYNRARYLDVRAGRFWGMDNYEGDPQSPISLHKYLYAGDDPTNKIDPSGHDIGLPGIMAGVAIGITIAAIAILHFHPTSERFGLIWQNNFDWYPYPASNKANMPGLTSGEIQEVKQWALESFKLAFSGYLVIISEGRIGTHNAVIVNERYIDRSGNEADGHTDIEGFSKFSYLHYPALLEDAQAAVGSADRASIIAALARGIGATAAHELGHQFGLLKMHSAGP